MLTRWLGIDDPWYEMDTVQREMEGWVRAVGGLARGLDGRGGLLYAASGAPGARVRDEGARLVVEVDVPGLGPDEVDVKVEGDRVEVRGRRALVSPDGTHALRQERSGWRIDQAWTLPMAVDPANADAVVKDGVLSVTLPKMAKPGPTAVPVRAE